MNPTGSLSSQILPLRASEIIGNANFGNIDTLLSHDHDMDYIARHYNMNLALVWALRLEGKTDPVHPIL